MQGTSLACLKEVPKNQTLVTQERNMLENSITWEAGQPLPRFANRKTLAKIISHFYFPISHRTLQNPQQWPLKYYKPNRAAVYDVTEAMEMAESKLKSAGVEI